MVIYDKCFCGDAMNPVCDHPGDHAVFQAWCLFLQMGSWCVDH